MAAAPAGREQPAPPLLSSPAGLRQAIVALVVLGPCRALAPYGSEAVQREPRRPE
jgi:hypothetical protein